MRIPYQTKKISHYTTTHLPEDQGDLSQFDPMLEESTTTTRSPSAFAASALIHAGVLVLVVWLATFFPVHLVQGATAAATSSHRTAAPAATEPEIGYGPLPKMNERVYTTNIDSGRYHWSRLCPILHRNSQIPKVKHCRLHYMTCFQATAEGRFPCFHCSRVKANN